MTDFKYIYKMSWYESERHIKSHTDMYYEKEEHTRLGHTDRLCRIMVVKVIEDSSEYESAINNSLIAEEGEVEVEKREERSKICVDNWGEISTIMLNEVFKFITDKLTDKQIAEVNEFIWCGEYDR